MANTRWLWLGVSLLTASSNMPAQGVATPEMLVPAIREPHHFVKLDNKYARVLDVTVEPFSGTLYHIHENPYFWISIGRATLRGQTYGATEIVNIEPADGEVRFSPVITHRVGNIAATAFRNITVQIQGRDDVSPAGQFRASPRPTGYQPKPALDNELVYIERLILEPGQSTGRYTLPRSGMWIAARDGVVSIERSSHAAQRMEIRRRLQMAHRSAPAIRSPTLAPHGSRRSKRSAGDVGPGDIPAPASSHAHARERFEASDELERRLKATVRGEVRFDAGSRALYATDSSNYRQIPIGIVVPMNEADIEATLAACREVGAPILPRGGGTSLAGQCCNVAVILDFSKYLNRIISLDVAGKSARVQPGIVLDRVRDAAEVHHLTFAPDPATHSRCTLGGMIGNNSCGVHALMGGKTVDNIHELDVMLYDGTRMSVGKTSDTELDAIIRAGGRKGQIYAGLKDLRGLWFLIRAVSAVSPRVRGASTSCCRRTASRGPRWSAAKARARWCSKPRCGHGGHRSGAWSASDFPWFIAADHVRRS
jgi:hypothetical protein